MFDLRLDPRRARFNLAERLVGTRTEKLLRAASSAEALMQVQAAARRRMLSRGRSIFITCMPKAGSTFLLTTLQELTGYSEAKLTYAYERNEQELYLPRLIDACFNDTITRHHTRANRANLDLLLRFGIRPVVLTRDLFDAAVSVRDHLVREGHWNFPSLYGPSDLATLSSDRQLDFVVDHAMPWYVQFYVSWYEAWRQDATEMLWLRYEELVDDWPAGIASVLDFHGLSWTSERIARAMRDSRTTREVSKRFNRGVVGRGRSELSDRQQQRIRELASHYRDVDFSFVGLEPPSGEPANR